MAVRQYRRHQAVGRVPLTLQKCSGLSIERVAIRSADLVNGGRDVVKHATIIPRCARVIRVGSSAVARQLYARAAAAGKRAQCRGWRRIRWSSPRSRTLRRLQVVADMAFGCAGSDVSRRRSRLPWGGTRSFLNAIRAKRSRGCRDGLTRGANGPPITPESRAARCARESIKRSLKCPSLTDGRKLDGDRYVPVELSSVRRLSMGCRTRASSPRLNLRTVSPPPRRSVEDAISLVNSVLGGNQACLFTTSGASARRSATSEVGNIGSHCRRAPMAFFPSAARAKSSSAISMGKPGRHRSSPGKVVVERWPRPGRSLVDISSSRGRR